MVKQNGWDSIERWRGVIRRRCVKHGMVEWKGYEEDIDVHKHGMVEWKGYEEDIDVHKHACTCIPMQTYNLELRQYFTFHGL